MSTCTHESMINHHGSGILADLRETLHVWRERQHQRRELAELSARDLHDVGLCWSDVAFEAEKPFWRAGTPPGRRRLLRGSAGDDFSGPREPRRDRASSQRPPA